MIKYLPADLLGPNPATGGDTGSHYWPVYTLKNFGFPEFTIKVWNPGNLMGEPHLVHYFPLPFIFMALLGFVMPLPTAFNVGTIAPLMLLPLCIFVFFRKIGMKFPGPILGAAFVLPYIYNESYSMWGGNTLSTMAGQFAHVYAFCFLFLGLGFVYESFLRHKISLWGVLFLAAVALSHAYVLLIVPVFFACFFLFSKKETFKQDFKVLFITGIYTLLLSVWFVYPMIDNNKWTTPLPMSWGFHGITDTFLSKIFYPIWAALLVALIFTLIPKSRLPKRTLLRHTIYWIIPTVAYCGLFYIFPKIGLVDARAVPQVLLFICLLAGLLIGYVFQRYIPKFGALILTVPLILLMAWWTDLNVRNFPHWAKWNYESWNKKHQYNNVVALSEKLTPGFSKPRVVFEHNDISNQAGTIRVFEMLPFFAQRATTESLYTQASILSPQAFYLQAKVSKTPSCPFRDFRCPPRGFDGVKEKFELLVVDHLIAITDETLEKSNSTGFLEFRGKYGPWYLYKTIEEPKFVEILHGSSELIPNQETWRSQFYEWFDKYQGGSNWLVVDRNKESQSFSDAIKAADPSQSCTTSLEQDFHGFNLSTNCPGKPHLIKVAYHSNLIPDSGSLTQLVSPGMIGFVPEKEKTRFDFGVSFGWRFSVFVSWISLFALLFQKFSRKEGSLPGVE
jgi:hypothetical protein